jgi:hypothetical protein
LIKNEYIYNLKYINMLKTAALWFAFILSGCNAFAQIPSISEQNGHHVFLVDGKPYFMLGGQAHNSSAWPGMMPEVWAAVQQLHLNTLEIPIYWEQIEKQQGQFDFSVVDTLFSQARAHNVHLVFLWFATWKNGSNHYMPEWMKRDAGKYPNVMGQNGEPVDSPSPNFKATLEADVTAFTAVMHHLKDADPQHTLIMMQVENESGSWGSVRDYSPTAQKLFEKQVPPELLKPEILTALKVPVVTTGTWQEVFGDRADEYFQAWSIAKYIGEVTAAGKAEYPLPMYVNTALRDPLTNPMANTYESGGPTDNVIPIWKAAAPAIDILAPDIYLSGTEKIRKVIDLYDRADNTLFVPEAAFSPEKVKYLYEVIARGGIGFSPFGIDDNGRGSSTKEISKRLHPFGREYEAIAPMMRDMAEWASEGNIKAVIEGDDHAEQTLDLGKWQIVVSFGKADRNEIKTNPDAGGKLLIIRLGENKFMLMGTLCHVTFKPENSNANKAWEYLKVEEGSYADGKFTPLRILNGDETDWGGPRFGEKPTILQTELILR